METESFTSQWLLETRFESKGTNYRAHAECSASRRLFLWLAQVLMIYISNMKFLHLRG
jgi:hypothetical protein